MLTVKRRKKITTAFSCSTINIVIQPVQKQEGIKDCGCFALAIATHLAFDNTPDTLIDCKFQQDTLRQHLMACFEPNHMTEFPKIV